MRHHRIAGPTGAGARRGRSSPSSGTSASSRSSCSVSYYSSAASSFEDASTSRCAERMAAAGTAFAHPDACGAAGGMTDASKLAPAVSDGGSAERSGTLQQRAAAGLHSALARRPRSPTSTSRHSRSLCFQEPMSLQGRMLKLLTDGSDEETHGVHHATEPTSFSGRGRTPRCALGRRRALRRTSWHCQRRAAQ